MQFQAPPVSGRLKRRYKRFLADVELADGSLLTAHCPNTGSLLGCKEEGSQVWLRDSGDEKRKLRFTWQAIRVGRTWVNVDTNIPNRVVYDAVTRGRVPELQGYEEVRREVAYGQGSRIDLYLSGEPGECYVEIKSTTLVEGETALFPDAVTERGLKHLKELQGVVRKGARAVQFFFISRGDARVFRPADQIDPAYGAELRRAAKAGVEVYAYTARVTPKNVRLGDRMEVDLS